MSRTTLKRTGLALVALGVVLFVVWGIRLASIGLALRQHLAQAQALADDPATLDPIEACDLVHSLREDIVALRQEGGMLIQIVPLLGWLPGIGSDLQAAPHLLDTADGLTEAGTLTCDVLEPVLVNIGPSGSKDLTPEQVITLLNKEQPTLKQALAAAERAQTAWDHVDVATLSPWIASKISKLDEGLPLLRTGLQMATVAPELLGANGPRTYLIMAQNDDELRPTGGFISGAGIVTIEKGQITELSFIDASLVDDYLHKPYPEPPPPLLDYMGSEIWLFRDANWSPDFPTSARQAASLYEYGQGVSVDGVIALNQHAIELSFSGLGEIYVAGTEEPITAANVRQYLREAWNPGEDGVTVDWIYSRKEFIGQLATAILERLETDPGSIDWVQVAKGVYYAMRGRHLLLFVDDQDTSNALAQVNWNGAIRETDGDYLMVIESNVGFNKANPFVNDTIDYRVALQADGTATAELSLTYTHQGQQSDEPCQQRTPYTGNLSYYTMMNRCYYNYLRVYVPSGSILHTATPHPTPAEYLIRETPADGQAVALSDEAGKTVFAQFFVVERGQVLTTRFEYSLPKVAQPSDGQHRYTLLIQKQAGTDNAPVSVTILLPSGAKLVTASPTPKAINESTLTFEIELYADRFIEITYE